MGYHIGDQPTNQLKKLGRVIKINGFKASESYKGIWILEEENAVLNEPDTTLCFPETSLILKSHEPRG